MRRILPSLLMVALLAAACSDDSSSSTPETTAAASDSSAPVDNAAFCAALDDLRTSIDGLANFDVIGQGTDALKTTFDDIKSKVDAVRGAATGDVKDKADAVGTAFETLQSDVDSAGTALDKGKALLSGLLGLQTALIDLGDAAREAKCS